MANASDNHALTAEHKEWAAGYLERQRPIGGVRRDTGIMAFRARFPGSKVSDKLISEHFRELGAYPSVSSRAICLPGGARRSAKARDKARAAAAERAAAMEGK